MNGPKGGTTVFALPTLPAPDGSGLVRLLQVRMHELRTYRVDETLASGLATIHSTYGFEAPDRMEADVGSTSRSITIGGTRYLQEHPNRSWQVESGGPVTQVPEFIWDFFTPFLDARILGHQTVQGRRTAIVSFFGRTGDVPIWFRLWVGSDGLVRMAQMRAIGHFMDHRYFDFNRPITIQPPQT